MSGHYRRQIAIIGIEVTARLAHDLEVIHGRFFALICQTHNDNILPADCLLIGALDVTVINQRFQDRKIHLRVWEAYLFFSCPYGIFYF